MRASGRAGSSGGGGCVRGCTEGTLPKACNASYTRRVDCDRFEGAIRRCLSSRVTAHEVGGLPFLVSICSFVRRSRPVDENGTYR